MSSDLVKEPECPFVWVESLVQCFIEIPLSDSTYYQAVEVQQLQIGETSGFLAVLYLHDGTVELLHEDRLPLDRKWCESDPAMSSMAVSSLDVFKHIDLPNFEIGPDKVVCKGEFHTRNGAQVRVDVETRWNIKPRPLFTPAPSKTRLRHNSPLRFLQLDFFSLLPASSKIELSIDGHEQQPSLFLLPRPLALYSSTRVGRDLLLASLNPDHPVEDQTEQVSSVSRSLKLTPATQRVYSGSRWFQLSLTPTETRDTDGVDTPTRPQHKNSVAQNANQNANLDANLVSQTISGVLRVSSNLGVVAEGEYQQQSEQGVIVFKARGVTQHWFPGFLSVARLCLYMLRRLRRGSSQWSAEINRERSPAKD